MNAYTRLSAKGQVVLPKVARTQLGWTPGEDLEVLVHSGAITLRAKAVQGTKTPDEVFARLEQINTYRGPKITDDMIEAAMSGTDAFDYPPK